MSFSKTTSYDLKSMSIIAELQENQKLKFSEAVNNLIHRADYLTSKVEELRQKSKKEGEL
jgi:hypothetical protein